MWPVRFLASLLPPRKTLGWLPRSDKQLLHLVSAGSGFLSRNDPREHFGLGAATKADELQVTWPDGRVERFRDLAGDHFYTIVDSGGSQLSTVRSSHLSEDFR